MFIKMTLRDLKKNFSQFLSIFLLLLLGSFIYVTLSVISSGMDSLSDKYYTDTNLNNAVVFGDSYTSDDIEAVNKADIVNNAEGRLQIDTTLVKDSKKTMQVNYISTNKISQMDYVKGEKFCEDITKIWIDDQFATKNKIKLGDKISLNNIDGEYVVAGTVRNPEYVYFLNNDQDAVPDYNLHGYCFLYTPQKSGVYNQILLDTDKDKKAIVSDIDSVLKGKNAVVAMRDDQFSYSRFDGETTKLNAIKMIFPVIFILVAFLTIVTTMMRVVKKQRTLIGIIKGLGFSDFKLYLYYGLYGFILSVSGCLIGTLLGLYAFPQFYFKLQKNYYTFPEWSIKIKPLTIIVILLIIVMCVLSCLFACRNELKENVAQVLRPKVTVKSNHSFLEKTKIWDKMKFDFQWNIRDMSRNKVRAVIVVIAVLGSTVLCLASIGLKNTIDDNIDYYYNDICRYGYRADIVAGKGVSKYYDNPDMQFQFESQVDVGTGNDNKVLSQLTLYSKGNQFKYTDTKGKNISFEDDGVYVTEKFASNNNLKKGDIIDLSILKSGINVKAVIKDIIDNPLCQGIFASKGFIEKSGYEFNPTGVCISKNVDCSKYDFITGIVDKSKQLEFFAELMKMINMLVYVLIAAAISLGIVAIYNISVLTYNERSHELATLKVLGFGDKRLSNILISQNIVLAAVGVIIGLPFGKVVLSRITSLMGSQYQLKPYINLLSYIISILLMLVSTLVISVLLGKKLKKIDMVSALKSVED